MPYIDDFVLGFGSRYDDGMSLFSDPGRYDGDGDGVTVTGRYPGSLYLDDIMGSQTGLEHLMPFVGPQLVDAGGDINTPALVDNGGLAGGDEPTIDPTPESGDGGFAAVLLAAQHHDAAPALIPIALHADDWGLGQLNLADHAVFRAVEPAALADAAPVAYQQSPAAESAAVFTLIAANPSLGGFLIVDTPYAYGDQQLPATLRPSLSDLLGLATDDDFLLPAAGSGAWALGGAAFH